MKKINYFPDSIIENINGYFNTTTQTLLMEIVLETSSTNYYDYIKDKNGNVKYNVRVTDRDGSRIYDNTALVKWLSIPIKVNLLVNY